MSRFERFELPVNKIQEYPLIFETITPEGCSLFQDVRRYQSVTTHLDVRIINVDGKIQLDPGMVQVPMGKLSGSERKELIEYLKLRITRGDNIGSTWVFFRPEDKKKPLVAFGANIVFRNAATGQARAIHLLDELQKSGPKLTFIMRAAAAVLAVFLVVAGGYFGYTKFLSGASFSVSKLLPSPSSPEMKFYKKIFPDLYDWLDSKQPDLQEMAKALLKPEYIADFMKGLAHDAYKGEDEADDLRANRLILFVYFNYNSGVTSALQEYRYKLEETEFGRLARIYSCDTSGYKSDIFYFKVGDLLLDRSRINQFLTENMISYTDYTRLRDAQGFSDMLKNDTISYQLKNFLSDVYTFSPLKVAAPLEDIDWYLLVRHVNKNKIDFAAFFKRGESTLIPREISSRLMRLNPHPVSTTVPPASITTKKEDDDTPLELTASAASGSLSLSESNLPTEGFVWYAINDDQRKALNLRKSAIGYFTEKIGQTFKLEVIGQKIGELELMPIQGPFPIAIHRDLLMEDSKGKYGVQCYDPITALVLSNVIDKSSFEESDNLSLKRDPIQINTTLIQLSKDDSSSTQAINISPGKRSVVDLFKTVDRFRGKLANGESVTFEKAEQNLFNPFTFMVYDDSITFSYRHDINGMTFAIQQTVLKIVTSPDGGYQIVETR